jgi:hypothetical protein
MSAESLHDRRILLAENSAECAGVAAHYLQMVAQYAELRNRAGMKYSLKCAVEHVKVAIASFKDLEALDQPVVEMSEAAE